MPRPKSETPTPGELEVLQVLWDRGPCTVRDVMETLNGTRPRAYTSVMSLLNVMVDKKLLRREASGKAFIYHARLQQKPTLKRMVGDLLDRAFGGSAKQLVVHALEQTDIPPDELAEIEKVIESHRKRQEQKS